MPVPRVVEVVVPVRPGTHDQYPLRGVYTREIVCEDGNLSRAFRDGVMESKADIVIWKHDDLCVNSSSFLIHTMLGVSRFCPIMGVAGSCVYAPGLRSPAWWLQGTNTQRGLVYHQQDKVKGGSPYPSLFGAPGVVAVLDGCLIAVRKKSQRVANKAVNWAVDEGWWDMEFTNHFYDIAFTMNASRDTIVQHGVSPCVVIGADVLHHSIGELKDGWHSAATRFGRKYSSVKLECWR